MLKHIIRIQFPHCDMYSDFVLDWIRIEVGHFKAFFCYVTDKCRCLLVNELVTPKIKSLVMCNRRESTVTSGE